MSRASDIANDYVNPYSSDGQIERLETDLANVKTLLVIIVEHSNMTPLDLKDAMERSGTYDHELEQMVAKSYEADNAS